MESYFFVPANKKKFIDKANSITTDYIVYDLEDSVAEDEIEVGLNLLSEINVQPNMYVRPRLFNDTDFKELNEDLLHRLIKIGYRNFLIPKFMMQQQLNVINNFISKHYKNFEFNFILLVESPLGLLNLREALESKLLNITGVGFGSHDYCSITGMKHTLENLSFVRHLLLNTVKAFNLKCIDIVSVDLDNNDAFFSEVENGFSMGFDAKFIIHPQQLEIMNSFPFYTEEEIKEAELVYPHILDIVSNKKSLIKINGKMYEKPHINRILKIINFKNKRYGTK